MLCVILVAISLRKTSKFKLKLQTQNINQKSSKCPPISPQVYKHRRKKSTFCSVLSALKLKMRKASSPLLCRIRHSLCELKVPHMCKGSRIGKRACFLCISSDSIIIIMITLLYVVCYEGTKMRENRH